MSLDATLNRANKLYMKFLLLERECIYIEQREEGVQFGCAYKIVNTNVAKCELFSLEIRASYFSYTFTLNVKQVSCRQRL